MNQRVTGIGGVFFKAADPAALKAWYVQHLGLPQQDGYVVFEWRDKPDSAVTGITLWEPFGDGTTYFEPSKAAMMVNFRVANLDELLETLRAEGVTVMAEMDVSELGRFGWIMDPEGNKVELWQPPDPSTAPNGGGA